MIRSLIVVALLAVLAASASAQTERAEAAALARVRGEAVVTGASRSALSGLTYVYLRPAVGGVEVADGPVVAVVDASGAIVFARDVQPAGPVASATDALGAGGAAERAAAALGLAPVAARGAEPAARRVYVRQPGGLRLAYEVTLYPANPAAWVVVQVDAETGDVLGQRRLAVFESAPGDRPTGSPRGVTGSAVADVPARAGIIDGASYLAFAGRSPLDGDRVLMRDPALAAASPFGWHDTDARPGPEFTTTRGNNVHAFPDRDADGLPDAAGAPEGGAALAFAPPLDLAGEPATYTEASVVNAFVWVNRFHDVLYAYGFDELSGNFQATAYGPPGAARTPDPVRVTVQNTSGTDNAYMTVPPDGASPALVLLESTRTSPRRDIALDTEVVLHESAHGLTARLTGGPSTTECVGTGGEDMAEGWSDWYALMLTMRSGDTRADARRYSAYSFGPSVRIAPYTTDRAVNATTYGSTRTLTARHAIGTVWATALWEVAWDLVDAHGFSPDLADARGAAGNQIALALVTEALRIQPCRPGFVDARNAVLQADGFLYGGTHLGLLWAAFARRGLGTGASQGSAATTADNVESFDPTPIPLDLTPPAAVDNLRAADVFANAFTLVFTAPGGDGRTGRAARYDIRVGLSPITTMTEFLGTVPVGGIPAPAPSGTEQRVYVSRLVPFSHYSVGVVAYDAAGNASPLATTSVQLNGVPPPPPPPPPPHVTALTDTLALVADVGGTAAGEVVLHNSSVQGHRVHADATGAASAFGGSDGFSFLLRTVYPHTARDPYPTLGRGGEVIRTWQPFPGSGRAPEDAGFTDRALPFAFPFGGTTVTSVRVYTDGYVSFFPGDAPPVYTDLVFVPSRELPNGIVAAYRTDLFPGEGGEVRTGLLADGRYAVEYSRMRPAGTPDTTLVSFAMTFAPSGEIGLAYRRVAIGLFALAAVESADGTETFVADGYADTTTLTLVDPGSRLALSPAEVDVGAGEEVRLRVTADGSSLAPGVYEGRVVVRTQLGAPGLFERLSVPLQFTVRGQQTAPPGVPTGDDALRAWPNPTAHATTLQFCLTADAPVELSVFDVRGREVAVLFDGPAEAGWTTAVWTPETAAVGLYVVRLVSGREVRTTATAVVR